MRYFYIVNPSDLEDEEDNYTAIPIPWNKFSDEFYSEIPDYFTVDKMTIKEDKEVDSVSVLYAEELSREDYESIIEEGGAIVASDLIDDNLYILLEDDI